MFKPGVDELERVWVGRDKLGNFLLGQMVRYLPSDTSGYIGAEGAEQRNVLWMIWVAIPVGRINQRVLAVGFERNAVGYRRGYLGSWLWLSQFFGTMSHACFTYVSSQRHAKGDTTPGKTSCK